MGDARLVVFRRDDPHVVRQFARDLLADAEPFRVDAVVVSHQDAHTYCFSIFFMPPMYDTSASGTAIEPSSC